AELIQNTVTLLAPADGFSVTYSPMPTVAADRAAFELVFRNLIGNAIKHHGSNNGTIEISSKEADVDGFVRFSVKDDGQGIEPRFHDRIFAIFQQLKPRDQVEGSGMGLAIVKKVIESRGGSIWIESNPGDGSTFHFTWPTRESPMMPKLLV
ncbi:MAG: ATP-binding protein, partial [Planctomycetaceae bacterium]